jgi:hypothetical protein
MPYSVLALELVFLAGFLLLLPRIGRKGLLFGVYVGEDRSETAEALRIRQAYERQLLFVSLGSLLLLAAGAGWGRPLELFGAALGLLVAGFFGSYLVAHFRARALAPAGIPPPAVAWIGPERGRPPALPLLSLAFGAAAGVVAIGYGVFSYGSLPARIPVHFGWDGTPDRWVPRSVAAVMLLPVSSFVVGTGLGALALLVSRAKRSVRHPDGEPSLLAQERFRRAVSSFVAVVGILASALLASLSISSIRVAAGAERAIPSGVNVLGIALFVVALGGASYLALRYGQGGAKLERAAAGAALTDGLADNRHWVLGWFYVNRNDPSLFIEHRFGVGYTINFGNWRAVALLAGFVGILAGILLTAAFAG